MKNSKHSSTRNNIKIWAALFLFLLLLIIIIFQSFSVFYLLPKITIPLLSIFLFIFFIFNLVARKSLSFKKYFTHPYNIITSKNYYEKVYNIPKFLMFEKTIEVLNDSKFKLIDIDKQRFEILAITKVSFSSWGENLYVSIENNGNETNIKFWSVTIFQIFDWGKNKENYEYLLGQIESSLTV